MAGYTEMNCGVAQSEEFIDLLRAGTLCSMELVGCLVGWLVSWLGR